jgi:hypothetical protein
MGCPVPRRFKEGNQAQDEGKITVIIKKLKDMVK